MLQKVLHKGTTVAPRRYGRFNNLKSLSQRKPNVNTSAVFNRYFCAKAPEGKAPEAKAPEAKAPEAKAPESSKASADKPAAESASSSSTNDGSLGKDLSIFAAGGALLTGIFVANDMNINATRAANDATYHPKKDSRYDLDTFGGRVSEMQELVDPRSLFYSDEDLADAKALLASFSEKKKYTAEEHKKFWEAKSIVRSLCHPVTGEKNFWAGRMSAFVPLNVPVAVGMTVYGPRSTFLTVFWQWVNQTLNVAANYVNRSGEAVEWGSLLGSYGLAVTTSIGLAVGMGKLVKSSPALQRFGLLVPFFAVASASSSNILFTRSSELMTGVNVYDKDDKLVGTSKSAAQSAIFQTMITRACILNIPILVLPQLIMTPVKAVMVNTSLIFLADLSVTTACIWFALPMALAIAPQKMEIHSSSLEPEFHHINDVCYANRGL